MRRKKKTDAFTVCNYIFFILIVAISIFPIYLILANAFSTEADIKEFGYAIFPLRPTWNAFRYMLKAPEQLLNSLWASIVYSIFGTLISVCVQAMLGYALSVREFAFRKLCTIILLITIFFNAGLIPHYITNVTIYHLEDSWLIYLLPGAVSATTVFVFRTFFTQVPESLLEAARIDGATDMQTLFRIVIPLSKPILAAQFFMGMAVRWKDYTTSLYYISHQAKYTLEYYIQTMLTDATNLKNTMLMLGLDADAIPTETMRFAVVFFTLVPMILMFPIFQKQLRKGTTAGGVKE